jgi:5-(aminomethyl)-3-furanmethanol phosphate kinase
MWVVKLGGSLHGDTLLPQWLSLLAELGGGRVTIVSGGGSLADEVRRLQGQWLIHDLAAHNMAVLAMAQGAQLLKALCPALELVNGEASIQPVLRRGQVAVWAPYELLREQADEDTNWDVTSDSIALGLARRLNAERLLVVKSCAVDPHASLSQLVQLGVLDRAFARGARGAGFPIHVIPGAQLDSARDLMLGASAPAMHFQPGPPDAP